jgi:hypothetical protein
MRNKEQYVHTLSGGSRLWIGLSTVVHYTVQIHPCLKLLANCIPSGQAGGVPLVEGERSLLHLDKAGHSSPTHWLPLHNTLNTTAHFNGSDGTAYIRLFLCRTQYIHRHCVRGVECPLPVCEIHVAIQQLRGKGFSSSNPHKERSRLSRVSALLLSFFSKNYCLP